MIRLVLETGRRLKRLILGALLFLTTTHGIQAQTVSNVWVQQEGQQLVIHYHLETKSPCKMETYLSENGGSTWALLQAGLSGDVSEVRSGDHAIVWNVLSSREQLVGSEIVLKVKAVSSELEVVTIGTQVWMTKNLDVDHFRNGDPIKEVLSNNSWAGTYEAAWSFYNNRVKFSDLEGRLYNWYVISDSRGICPDGFKVPTESDWDELREFCSKFYSKSMRSREFSSLFNVRLTGMRSELGEFSHMNDYGYYWISENDALYVQIDGSNLMIKNGDFKQFGASIRCVKIDKD